MDKPMGHIYIESERHSLTLGTDQKHSQRHSWGLLGPQSIVLCHINGMKIFMQTDFKKLTDASTWGPKRPQECQLRLKKCMMTDRVPPERFLM